MEIRTCEEYVVTRIEDLEHENANLKFEVTSLKERVTKLETVINKVKEILVKYAKIRTFKSEGVDKKYISMDVNQYLDSEVYAYNKLLRFTDYGIKEEE